jgi:pyruvate dehydrogenase E2 component (dihydrolipoamide acetyltransferase)
MYLSVSIDHRIVDGATGARWMNVVKSLLENPQRLLLGSL